ncbi:MAG: (deoxy)nucleoside triphosphate pyrophosphohydrolase [Vampirovibrionia bacterium]
MVESSVIKKVTAAIIEKDAKILIARRKKGDKMQYKWEFPGGKIKQNESPEACLKRELFEEFAIYVCVKEYVCSSNYVYPHIAIELMAYRVEYISGEFKLTDHDLIEWLTPDQLLNYDLAEADIPVAKTIIESYRL